MVVSITVSNSEQSLTQKHVVHEDEKVMLSHDDMKLSKLVADAVQDFGPGFEDVALKIKMVW